MKKPIVNTKAAVLFAGVLLGPAAVIAQTVPKETNPPQDMPGMNHSAMGHGTMPHPEEKPAAKGVPASQAVPSGSKSAQETHADHTPGAPPATASTQDAQQHGSQTMPEMNGANGMAMGPMQGGKPPIDARDPAAYAEGTTNAHIGDHAMADDARFGRVLLDNLEFARGDGERGQNIDAEAWYGGDYNKVWVKAEGERRDGKLGDMRTEALWDRTFATFWSTQLGIRHDAGAGPSRNWLAFGVRGLAPYWFDTEVTGYWRSGGAFAARAEVSYEILFTPRLILQPELSADLYSRNDPERGIGSGVSDIEFGLRLRYEIRRQFAPYIGVAWSRKLGDTADMARAMGEDRKTVQAVAGVRLWF